MARASFKEAGAPKWQTCVSSRRTQNSAPHYPQAPVTSIGFSCKDDILSWFGWICADFSPSIVNQCFQPPSLDRISIGSAKHPRCEPRGTRQLSAVNKTHGFGRLCRSTTGAHSHRQADQADGCREEKGSLLEPRRRPGREHLNTTEHD